MDHKLTLKLDQAVIEQAKQYARAKNTSLSKLIESYLGKLVASAEDDGVSPIVQSLSGIVDLPKNYDHKKAYKKHLSEKYAK